MPSHVSRLVPRAVLVFLATASAGVPVLAQTSTVPPFVLQSDEGDNRLQLGGMIQLDGRFSSRHEDGTVDTFSVRRARITTQGRLARYFDFFFNVDFAGGVTNVFDAYVDTRFSDAFHVRAGKFKPPFSYERLIAIGNVAFLDRGQTTAVATNRDVGVQILGSVLSSRLGYAVSLTNGTADGGSADTDTNDGKDVTARLMLRPWALQSTSALSGLGLALAVSAGEQPSALPSFSSPGRHVFFAYADAHGAGRRVRWSPQAFYYHGPFGGYAELVRSDGEVRGSAATTDITHQAWQLAGSWVLTGEAASEQSVRPRANFDPSNHTWGAVQVVGRVDRLTIEEEALRLGLSSPGSSRGMGVLTLGVNWYLNPFVRWALDYERATFTPREGLSTPNERVLVVRSQLAF